MYIFPSVFIKSFYLSAPIGLEGYCLCLVAITTPFTLSRSEFHSDFFQIWDAGSFGWSFRQVWQTFSHLINYAHDGLQNGFGQPCGHHLCSIVQNFVQISTKFGMRVPLASDSDDFDQRWHIPLNMCIYNDFELFCGYSHKFALV